MSKNLRGLSGRKGLTDSLFTNIVKAGSSNRDSKDLLLKEVSDKYLVGRSSVLSSSSFYEFLEEGHRRKKAYVCDGTACLTSGRSTEVKKALLSRFSEDEIGTVSCLGHCHSGNAFLIDGQVRHFDNPVNPSEILEYGTESPERLHSGTNALNPVLISAFTGLNEYYGVLKNYVSDIPRALNEIEISTLRGRGGAGFPLHIKLKTSANTPSDQKYVVCNADEGDPGAFSDKWLLENRPHSILFGMLITGLIIGAGTGVIYVRGEYPEAIRSISAAIDTFKKLKFNFTDLNDKPFTFEFHLFRGQGAYICGEETSLLNSLEGLRPEVRSRPPFPATYGLFGKPTILCNVETFSNLYYILKEGGQAYSAIGTQRSRGTKLVSLDGAFKRPGIYEVVMGTSLGYVLNEMGGGTKYPVRAFQIGGPLGGIVPLSEIKNLTLDYESFSDCGFLLGHAGVVSIPEEFPMMKFILHLFEFTAKESCGKCFPCRIGSQRGYELLKNAFEKGIRIDKDLFYDLLETMKLGSLCALGGGISLPVLNALHYFASDFDGYFNQILTNHG